MNKLLIPTILVATVMIAGVFAFIPIDNATTFHLLLNQGVSGATFTIFNSTSTDDLDDDIVYHNFILESDVPFTIHDITVRGEIEDSDTSADDIRVKVRGYPAEYLLNATAARDDHRMDDICDDCGSMGSSGEVVDGNDKVKSRTWSMTAVDKTQSTGDLTFGPDSNIVVQVCFDDDGGSASDYSAEVTFYLRGIFSGDDVTLTPQLDTGENLGCRASVPM